MKKEVILRKAQALYYGLRKAGLSHSLALRAVIDYVEAAMPEIVPPAKPARRVKKRHKR